MSAPASAGFSKSGAVTKLNATLESIDTKLSSSPETLNSTVPSASETVTVPIAVIFSSIV